MPITSAKASFRKAFVFLLCVQAQTAFSQTYSSLPEIVATNQPHATNPSFEIGAILKQGDAPKWIWGDDQDQKYALTKSFSVAAGTKGYLIASCDNIVSIKINGKDAGRSDSWETPVEKDISSLLVPGENRVEATVSNAGGISGFVCQIGLIDKDQKLSAIGSDESWQATSDTGKSKAVRVVSAYGEGPWKRVLDRAGTAAQRDFQVQPGFQIERLFSVPKDELGSWVCITLDPKGRIIASDQGEKGLVRITPSPIGSNEPTQVEKLDVDISSAQGLLFAFGGLYVSVNGNGSGLYRLRDTDGDDRFDEKSKLATFRGGGEHGPHALRLSPDGKSIVVAAGNHTLLPAERILQTPIQRMGRLRDEPLQATLPENMKSRIAPTWDEDVLPTRQWDANGHATGIFAPGGWMAQCDPDGKVWEILSIGYRNQYDFDFNAEGDMFVYDSDMEWDVGTPWYRPTRVVHASSGSEFGWRSGTACWPTDYVDSLPSLVDIGPGSPVGVTFGYGAKFPDRYQRALYLCDWTFGTIYAIHMEPDGSTYRAVKEEFLSRSPLPLTDALVGKDGALYFTVGGRGTQSELYRVTYIEKESVAPADPSFEQGAELRKLRRDIEAWHRDTHGDPSVPIEFLVQHLGHSDPYIRYAARVALERMDTARWWSNATKNPNIDGLLQACLGAARSGAIDRKGDIYSLLARCDWSSLSTSQQRDFLRTLEVVMIRLGKPEADAVENWVRKLEGLFPSQDQRINRELCSILVAIDSPQAPALFVPLLEKKSIQEVEVAKELLERNKGYGSSIAAMLANQPDLQQMHYAFVLREQKSGWTPALRKAYFEWFKKAQGWSGGNSYQKFLTNISNDAYSHCTDVERLSIEALGLRTPAFVAKEIPKAKGPGKEYLIDEVASAVDRGLQGRDFENGKRMYAAAKCVVCHRFAGEGGATGPDLTQVSGRFSARDLTEAILDPSKVISDQYKTVVLSTEDGNVTGRILSESENELLILTDPEDSTKTQTIAKKDIVGQKTSAVSVMPKDLLKGLNEEEVLDLMAYLLTRGDAGSPVFKKAK
ncbi:c-type cytochrome [Pirellulaceae bacterium SH501]